MPSISRRRFFRTLTGIAGTKAFGRIYVDEQQKLSPLLQSLSSPVLFSGDERLAFRDPAAIFHEGWLHLYFTLIREENDNKRYSYIAWSKSCDLVHWTSPVILTPRDKLLEYGSPGNIVRVDGKWILCLQSYPRPHGERYGNRNSRIWTMSSYDLQSWDEPQLLRVKGPHIAQSKMGRMIDPFLLPDKDQKNLWWCLYKQNGISISRSSDLTNWRFVRRIHAGENPCVIVDNDEYVLFHSPANGIGKKRSNDLMTWRDEGITTLGQQEWNWAKGRITAGFVIDLRKELSVGKALMFFHASRFHEQDARGGFDNFASIGIAWSSDLNQWEWPGK